MPSSHLKCTILITPSTDLPKPFQSATDQSHLDLTFLFTGDNRGINSHDFVEKEKANVRIAYAVKTEDYRQFLLEVFKSETNAHDKSISDV